VASVHLGEDAQGNRKGYAFVNFLSAEIARRFRAEFDNKALPGYPATHKVVEMCAADTQGFYANAQKYLKQQAHRVVNPWFKPMIFMQVEDEIVAYPLCTDHLPKDVLEEIIGSLNDTSASTLRLKDPPEHVSLSNWSENSCELNMCKDGEGDVIDDVEVLRCLMEAAVHEICQHSGQYQ